VFFYLSKKIFAGFSLFEGNFVCGQDDSKRHDTDKGLVFFSFVGYSTVSFPPQFLDFIALTDICTHQVNNLFEFCSERDHNLVISLHHRTGILAVVLKKIM